jgi:hypothetical protein
MPRGYPEHHLVLAFIFSQRLKATTRTYDMSISSIGREIFSGLLTSHANREPRYGTKSR